MAVYVLISEPFAGCIVWENQRRAWACFCDLHAVTGLLPEYHWALSVFMMENSGPKVFGGRGRKPAAVKVNTRWCPSSVSF